MSTFPTVLTVQLEFALPEGLSHCFSDTPLSPEDTVTVTPLAPSFMASVLNASITSGCIS